MTNINQQLQQAMRFFQTGDLSSAKLICQKILTLIPNQADSLHLLALIYKQKQQYIEAEKYFIASVKSAQQASFFLNFANFYAQTNRVQLAIDNYEKSNKLDPTNLNTIYNWSLSLNQQGQYQAAIEIINKALKLNDQPAKFYNVLGNAYKNIEQYDEAINAFNKAIASNATDFFAWHNLGVTYRIMGKPEKSIFCYKKITSAGNTIPEYHFNLGCAHYDLGNLKLAEVSLKQAIQLRPDYVMAHEAINNLYWEDSQKNEFLQSYNLYMKSNQQPTESMSFSHAAQLILSKQLPEATEVLQSAIQRYGSKANFSHALATIYIKENINESDSVKLIENAVNLEPNNTRYRIDMANILIRQGEYIEALKHLDSALKISPLNQEIWGYKGICWRLLNDEREHWLNNYDKFVIVQKIIPPETYDNLDHFISNLKEFMVKLHNSTRQPLDQSVMGGSQTSGNLLLNSAPIIQQLKEAIYNNARKYIDSLPSDPTHPFLSRITPEFNFSGCWSVLLNNKGFHTNHVHPEGWLSGPTYISIPETINPVDPKKSGWVHFGETSLNLGDREVKAVEHCPQEGDCVFFPSYMWHGTNPTITDEIRMTTPCDIQPKG